MSLAEWLEKIQQTHPKDWDLGLERVGAVGKRLGVLRPADTVFLVAGTNGKGSCCEYLSHFCHSAGLKVGKTTSPYLQRYNEQIVVDQVPVSDDTIVAAFEAIDKARGDVSLTYFEFGALAAMLIFKQQSVDVAILEIGLGGRLDAMNIVDPDVSIITPIGLDHQTWLGDSVEQIAVEKAGIMRADKPVVVVEEVCQSTLLAEAERQQATAYCLGRDFHYDGAVLSIGTEQYDIPETRLPLPSALAAVAALVVGGFAPDQQTVTRVLAEAGLPGRFQRLPGFILDVAHNPAAAKFLAARLWREGASPMPAVVGLYRDKDIAGVFQELAPYVSHWHLVSLPGDRGASAASLAAVLSETCGLTGRTYDKVPLAVDAAKADAGDDHPVLVFGSFVTVAAVLKMAGRTY